jgi:periplasmic protein TonB
MANSQSPRPDPPVALPESNAPLWWAWAGSLALHVIFLSLPGMPMRPLAPVPEQQGGVLTARIELLPPPAPKPPREAEKAPAGAPPKVLKNTLDLPQAEILKDPIEPKPKPKPPPKPRAERPKPKPAEAKPPRTETAAAAERPGLDLRLPQDQRGGLGFQAPRNAPAEQLSPNELRETLGRLSETILFPPEALERGLEGEVTLLVQLGEGGRILDASIASGSGYKILDDAAVRAVLKLGTLGPSSANKSILLPVRFRIL